MTGLWSGQWVADRLGLALEGDGGPVAVTDLVGVAVRYNARRSHLLVSTVLGKHVPADPRVVYDTGRQLGDLVAQHVAGQVVVLGYAETATGLGHTVADALGADYLHSTRRHVAGVEPLGGFEEEHSHATSHLLLPEDPSMLSSGDVLVLVDDELSTGRTALNTIASLHADHPREHYVIAALVDVRDPDERHRMASTAAALGVRVDVVALAAGRVTLPAEFAPRAAEVIAAQPGRVASAGPVRVRRAGRWPTRARDGGRHGFGAADRVAAHAAATECASAIATELRGDRVLVLGFEELIYAPLLLARAVADLSPRRTVRFSSTTRSPVVVIDEPGYPIRSGLMFASHDDPDDGPGTRYAYNIGPGAFTDVVVVVDDVADTAELHAPGGLLSQLGVLCDDVHLVTLPSYRPVSVGLAR
ncbi:MAG: Phosphoribosyltransferase-like predicted ribonucleoside biosynthesis protein [Pseudonocardiales bacterium]|nr:Phosphoribosyltransferase-like predicted ribonucleoside biosynthesis protein [Pseudonocardiales bacterium]